MSAPQEQPFGTEKKSNFIVRFWRGEFSLGISYWAFGIGTVAAGYGAGFLLGIAAYSLDASDHQTMVSTLPVSIALITWWSVGTWNSADNHIASTGRKGWATTAKVFIVLGLMRAVKDGIDVFNGTV